MEEVFDRAAVRRHRARAGAGIAQVRPVLAQLAARLLDRLDDTPRHFRAALDLGGRGVMAPALAARGVQVVSADGAAEWLPADGLRVVVDEEALPFGAQKFDLIIAQSLHWVNDLPGALIQLRRALQPDGLFLAAMPVLGTLASLRSALLAAEAEFSGAVNPRVSPFPELRDCAGLLQRAGFLAPVADVEDIEFLYAEPLALLHDLRAAGETNAVAARSRRFVTREIFAATLAALPLREGRAVATLRLAIMTGWGS